MSLSPVQIVAQLEAIDADLSAKQTEVESAARAWFIAKREREKERATVFLTARMAGKTVAEADAMAAEGSAMRGAEEEAAFEALRAACRVLETRASIGQSLLRAHTQGAGWQPTSAMHPAAQNVGEAA